MADTLYQLRNGIATNKTFPSLYSTTFDKIVLNKETEVVEAKEFFAERSTNLGTYKEGEVHTALQTPIIGSDTDPVPMLVPTEGYNKTATLVTYYAGISITEDAVSMQKTNLVVSALTGLPDSAIALQTLACVDMFNRGATVHTSGDGDYIFDTTHAYPDARQGTYSNMAGSGSAFTTDSFFAAWLSLKKRKNSAGRANPQTPTAVYYPVDQQDDVSQVHNSSKYPSLSTNAEMDELFSAWRMVPGVQLSSTTAWFVIGNNAEKDKGLLLVWRIRPGYKNMTFTNPYILMGKSLKMSFDVKCLHSRNMYMNEGA